MTALTECELLRDRSSDAARRPAEVHMKSVMDPSGHWCRRPYVLHREASGLSDHPFDNAARVAVEGGAQ